MATTNTRIVIRRDESGRWASVNPELLAGEQGFETDTGKYKIGTGANWNATPYVLTHTGGMIGATGGVSFLEEASVRGLFGATAPLMYDEATGMISGDVYSKAETDMGIGMGATGAFVAAEAAQAAADAAQAEVDAMQTGATGIFIYEGDLYTNDEVDAAIGLGATGAFVAAELAQEGVDGLIASGATGALTAAEAAQEGVDGLIASGATGALTAAEIAQEGVDGLIASGATGALAAAEAAQDAVDDILSGATGGGFVGTFTGPLAGQASTVQSLSNHDTDDLNQGINNLYYTEARFTNSLRANSTTDLPEGLNLYYTDDRVKAVIGATGSLTYTDGIVSFVERSDGEVTTLANLAISNDTTKANAADFDTSSDVQFGTVSATTFTGDVNGDLNGGIDGVVDLSFSSTSFTGATGFDATSVTELQTAVTELQTQINSLVEKLKPTP